MSDDNSPIIHITQSLGGIETYLTMFLKYYQRDRKIIIILPEECGLAEYARSLNVKVYIVRMLRSINPIQDICSIIKLWNILKRYNRPIIHLHSSKAGGIGRIVTFLLNNKCTVLYTPNGFYYLGKNGIKRILYKNIERILRYQTHLLVASSESEKRRAIKDIKFKNSRVVVVPNSVEIPVKKGGGRNQNEKIVLMIGRITYQKNIEMYLRVASKFTKRYGHNMVIFKFIGVGYYKNDHKVIDELVRINGLNDIVELLPWMSQKELYEHIESASRSFSARNSCDRNQR
jgi:glycosyltransferase involved in cell wall biosynthesis